MTIGLQFDLAQVRAALPGRRIDWFETLDSTMLEAQRDPEPGRIVGADQQTAGMGRHGGQWLSPAGEGLYISIVLPTTPVPLLMLALGLAAQASVDRSLRSRLSQRPDPQPTGSANQTLPTSPTPLSAAPLAEPRPQGAVLSGPHPAPPTLDLRWPNDLLINTRKAAGILATAHDTQVIAGIGINVSQSQFPPNLETPATSLALEGIATTREALLITLIKAIDQALALPPAAILDQFTRSSSYAQNRRVQVEAGGRRITGVTTGLDPAGFLQVREDNGTVHTILAGGVRPA